MTIRVLHVISGLVAGGAENMLLRLAGGAAGGGGLEQKVFALRDGPMRARFLDANVELHIGGLDNVRGLPGAMSALRKLQRAWQPNVIQGWMYHGNLAAMLAGGLSCRRHSIWNIRQTLYDIRREKQGTAAVIRANAALSWWPRHVVYNSTVSRLQHEAFGFSKRKSTYIANGVDTAMMSPDPIRRSIARKAAGLSTSFVVGMAARCHPMKSHDVFLRAAAACVAEIPELAIVLAGSGVQSAPSIAAAARALDLGDRLVCLGEVRDMRGFYDLLDVCCLSSSWGEGFPNVIMEAMACGVPCVATAVGDTPIVLGDAGYKVEVGDADAMAQQIRAIHRMSATARQLISARAREHVESSFGLPSIAAEYHRLYEEVSA